MSKYEDRVEEARKVVARVRVALSQVNAALEAASAASILGHVVVSVARDGSVNSPHISYINLGDHLRFELQEPHLQTIETL